LRASGTSGGNEGISGLLCNTNSLGQSNFGVAGIFDKCESYGFNINIDNDASVEYAFTVKGDGIANSNVNTEGTKTVSGTSGLGLPAAEWIVSENINNNAVEFSLKGWPRC